MHCRDLWLLKIFCGLLGIADPDVLKAIEEEEIASNCADQDPPKGGSHHHYWCGCSSSDPTIWPRISPPGHAVEWMFA